MTNFINDLKLALVDIHEEEQVATKAGNQLHANGLAQARIIIESLLDKNGIERPARL